MNKADRIELEVAYELVAIAISLMEIHYDEEDIQPAVAGTLATALEIACKRRLQPLERIFQ